MAAWEVQEGQGLLRARKNWRQRSDRNKFWLLLCSESAFTSPVLTASSLLAQIGHVSKARVRGDPCQAGLLQGESFRETMHTVGHPKPTQDRSSLISFSSEGVRDEEILYLGTKQQSVATCTSQKNHTEEKLFAPYRLTVNLTVVPVQTDSLAWEGQEKENHPTDGFVFTTE